MSTKHQTSADAYRERFGLPASRGLHSTEIREKRADRGRELWHNDEGFRARLQPIHTTPAERMERARTARSDTANRAGVRAAGSTSGKAAHQAWLAIRDRSAATAVAAGFHDLDTMLAVTQGIAAREVAALLRISTKQLWALRRRHGYVSTGGGRPPGIDSGESRLCQECGRFYKGLGQHIRLRHNLSSAEYRDRHPFDPGTARTDCKPSAGKISPSLSRSPPTS